MPDGSTTNALGEALARCRSGLAAAFGFSMIANLLILAVPLYMLQVFDRVLMSQSTRTLAYLTILAAGALVLLGVFTFLRSRVLVRLGTWVDRVLAPSVFLRGIENALRGAPYRTEALRDLATLRSFLGGSGIMALFDSPWVPVYVFVIYLLHPTLGHIALGGAAVLFVAGLAMHRATRGRLKTAGSLAARNLRAAESAYRNAEAIDGMGMGAALARRWDRGNAEVLALQAAASDRAGTITAFTKFFRLVLQTGILGAGAWLVLRHELTPGGMIAASIVLSRALAPVEQAIGTWKQTTGASEAWRRLADLFAQPPLHPAVMPIPPSRGHLRVEGVTYTPPGAKAPVLRGISLEVKPGEVLAIIGPSAAGKSTLARLMVGIGRPQAGAVRLDGAEVFAHGREEIGRHVGYLPQDVELFPGTVRENIARMAEGEPEKVVAAAEMAGVHEMILRLPEGYETEIGEQGGLLSGGQRQRIALARALYGNPPLLVLDEPNASLDAAGEEALHGAIAAAKEAGAAVVLIAHRPSMLTHVDRLAVLKEGRLQDIGE
ncbi:MAG: type I secretion system permease/ATPase, partial [Rhodospirillales bacterium]|nr:type I secretion system permease/ATPase [Rhodospirillales bacterium]